jgi:hypothetical protein
MTNTPDKPTNGAKDLCEPRPTAATTSSGSDSTLPAFGLIGLALLAVFFLIVNGAMFAGAEFDNANAGLVLGVIAAEITLCAVFAALAPVSVFLRTAIGMVAAIVVCLAIFRMGGPGARERLEISAAAFLQWIAVQIPLSFFRFRFGWYLRRTSGGGAGFMRQDLQFGIRQLMAWTAVVAVLLSIAKTAVPDDSFAGAGNAAAEIVAITLILVVFNSLAAWPMIWAAFVRSRMLAWCGVAAACSFILCVGELWAFRTAVGPGVDFELFVAMHLIQLVAVGGSLLLVRLNGVRLVRDADHDHAILQSGRA